MRAHLQQPTRRQALAGSSLPEAIFAVCIMGLMVVSLYTGFSSGFAILRAARENLRATEILNRHTERLRLYTWSQLLDTQNYLRPTFSETAGPVTSTNNSAGVVYAGTVEMSTPTNLPAAYRDQVRLVTISLAWTNWNRNSPVVNQRQVQTYVSRFGMQSYVIGP